MGCTRVVERVCAAVGLLQEAAPEFATNASVARGGVLWALPALLANGLLRRAGECFRLPPGFYSLTQIFVLLAAMALARVRTIEQLRYQPAGEWGKLLGLDRIPEVRTLREKVKVLAQPEGVSKWGQGLAQEWMAEDPEAAGFLYVDGHVRPYHGRQTKLPRRYVARQRLCLRGMTDYWVNDQQGRPFFVISTALTPGLLATLKQDLVPRLLGEVPGQPSAEELASHPYRCRFTLIYDREGYSPEFFQSMWELRIACQTYHKYPRENWPVEEFTHQVVRLAHGESVRMQLAERGTRLGNGMWVREIRKRTETGHQVSILSTHYEADMNSIAAHMFARWSQENFFQYMMQHFAIDRLGDYQTGAADETAKVVNPAYRKLQGEIKSKAGKLSRKLAEFGALSMPADLEAHSAARHEQAQGKLREEIEFLEKDLATLKAQRKETDPHVRWVDLPEPERFVPLAPTRKQFLNTIKMIVYRAETAMASLLREVLARSDDARALLREIFTTDVDLIPDAGAGTLTVRLHHLTNRASDEAVRSLAEHLNVSETVYPGTNLRLVYKMVSD
ncbi:MAG: putative transposase [Bryobacteraceae bacterium]